MLSKLWLLRDRIQRAFSPLGSGRSSVGRPANASGCFSTCARTKRPIFQSLFPKFRACRSFASESSLSAPAETPEISAKRSASAPYSSMRPSGLTTFPSDLLIFTLPTRTRPWR